MKIPATNQNIYFSTKKSSDHTHTDWSRAVAEPPLPRNRTNVISVNHTAPRGTTTNAASYTVEQNTADTVSPEDADSAALTTGEHAIMSGITAKNITVTATENNATTAKPSSVAITKSLNDPAFADLSDMFTSKSITAKLQTPKNRVTVICSSSNNGIRIF